jgi:hypothetical protein
MITHPTGTTSNRGSVSITSPEPSAAGMAARAGLDVGLGRYDTLGFTVITGC